MNDATADIDGFGPLPLVRPASVAELGTLIREGVPLYPFGGRTKLALGNSPTTPGRALDLTCMAQIIDYPARDMTVTVQTGITIKHLYAELAREKLRLPIDVAQASRATLGGILATNTSGPRRLGFGTLRDYVIGISALNDDGNEFKAGGRVVKNVAGYDICKLLVGALGTLGIITQVTLKLRPLADEQALITLPCEADHLDTLLTHLHNTRTRPVCIDLLNRTAAGIVFAQAHLPVPESAWTLLVGYEGNEDTVAWQVQQFVKEVPQTTWGRLDARVGFTAQPLWDALVEFAAWPEAHTTFKANLLPSTLASFCRDADRALPCPALRAHAGTGIVFGSWAADLTSDLAATMLTAWRKTASVIVQRCPTDWKTKLNVWGPAPSDAWLMREVKAKLDPRRIFNPGRFVDGV